MKTHEEAQSAAQPPAALSNAEIADRLAGLAQLLSTQKENPYKVKAYHRAAARIRSLAESLDELVREDADLTQFSGIGDAIAIREIVLTGKLRKLETLRGQTAPEVASLADYPRLDPKRVLRVYKKLKISSIEALREKLESGEIESALGHRMTQHVRQGLSQAHAMLLYRADDLRDTIEESLLAKCAVKAAQVVGAFRRRVEVIEEIAFMIETDDFPAVVKRMQRFGGRTALLESSADRAIFALAAGITLRLRVCSARIWGLCLIAETGSEAHLEKVEAISGKLTGLSGKVFTTENRLLSKVRLKVHRARTARRPGELDYTICSIHSRFGLNREQQTERLLRAMDNRYFNILGHATGRLLLKRPGYEIDIDRVIEHARQNRCFFEINSSPDRLDLAADNARRAAAAGVLIAINTDSHGMGEPQLVRCGLDQARRAGLAKSAVLNCRSWQKLHGLFRR